MPEKEKTEIEKTITALRDRIKTKQEVIHNGGDGVVDFMWDLSTQLFVKDGFKTMFHVKDNSSYNNDSRFTSIPVLSQIVGAGAFTMGIGMTAIAAPFKGVQSLGRKISLGWYRLKLGKAEKQKAKEEKATQEKAEELRKKEEITVLEKQLEVRKQCEEEAKKLGINFNTVLKQIEDAGGMDKFKRDMEVSYYHDKGGNVAGRKDLDTDGYLENIKSNKRWGAGSAMACFGFAVLFNALGGKGFDQNHIGEVLNGISSGEGAGFVDYWMLSLSTIAAGFSTIPGLQYFDNFFEEKRLKTEDSIRKLKNKLTGVIPIGYGGNKI
jgi:hypothetical protein